MLDLVVIFRLLLTHLQPRSYQSRKLHRGSSRRQLVRLRDAGLPDPIVGGHNFDPTGIADRLGVKGLSVYTAFIEMWPSSVRPLQIPFFSWSPVMVPRGAPVCTRHRVFRCS